MTRCNFWTAVHIVVILVSLYIIYIFGYWASFFL